MKTATSPVTNHEVDSEDLEIDQRIYDLYDKYCHGFMDRREFLKRAGQSPWRVCLA